MPSIDMSRALTFGTVAEEYEKWRPGYPDDAVDWLAATAHARVTDAGAGTGKLTSLLIDRGFIVEAVEPDPRMLAVLMRGDPAAHRHHSTSDAAQPALPFPSDEVGYATFPWVWEITSDHYAANMATSSAVLAMKRLERDATLDAVRAVLRRVGAKAGRSTLPIQHAAACARWVPRARYGSGHRHR
jgi:SAM-dependent methyltransferase